VALFFCFLQNNVAVEVHTGTNITSAHSFGYRHTQTGVVFDKILNTIKQYMVFYNIMHLH